MNILFLSRWFPFPPDNGSKLRAFNLIKILSREHTVDLLSFTSEPISEERTSGLKLYCQEIVTVLFRDYNPRSTRSLLGFFSTRPRYIVDTFRKGFQESVYLAFKKTKYDLVVASQVDMMPYTLCIADTKVLIDEIELTVHNEERSNQTKIWQKIRAYLTRWKHSRYVTGILERVDGFSVVSDPEMGLITKINKPGCRGLVMPNGIDMDFYKGGWGNPEPDTLIYAGALTYHANLDAMQYFISQIFPLIKDKRPLAKLYITGKMNDQIRARLPVDSNVEFTGYLEDVRPRIGSTWISVIPLRIGGGTRLKVLESLALGTPVVSTSKGAEGLELKPGRDIIIKDVPEEFAFEVVNILENIELRTRLGIAGKQTVGSLYNWKLIGDRFLKFIDESVFEK